MSNFQGGTWLFDVGECTQLQIQKTSSIKPSKITKIFLTHAHGDHSFGLPGLLCLMGQDRDRENSPPVEIYGPEGLRMWLRVAIRYSGGRNIYPQYDHPLCADGAPMWEIEDEEDVKVYAAPMSHGIPCLGYVVDELPRPGRLRNEVVEPIVKRNVQALREAGFTVPMKAMAVLKNLPPGNAFTFPDGTVVQQEDAVEPPREGRKVVIGGDTADCRALRNLAQNADLVIHEATNCYLQGVDKDTDVREVTRDAVMHGHSTPQIAGDFARSVNAKRLVLNHFSARY
ncbi:predicted protein, partial [Phaeodactylum tricornutum CCAP 1055/1]